MKKLRIEFGDKVIWDGEIDEFNWSESDSGIKVEGRLKRRGTAGTGNGFLDLLASAQRRQTNSVVAQRKNELEVEKQSWVADLKPDTEEDEVQVQT